MKPKMQNEIVRLPISTRNGTFIASYSAKGLAGLNFPSNRNSHALSAHSSASPQIRRWHRMTAAALKHALAGRASPASPPLDISRGTAFQRRVWRAMSQIACGQTRSYGEIARSIGQPKAVRAVGGACGANPIPVFIPCHRVLAANQKIGGFSGGLKWKRTLLAREGVQFGGS
ncbi:MAG: methylated-DNA--[protein]-cysteine S-methyltransferase [Verrucomicrobia bacterium]|nr:methylated-DNA--[protein]-cysteine S-methyltransferase [Verrucomicrobiota bacterium]